MSEPAAANVTVAAADPKPAGELWVWLCGMGLALGLIMVAGLLGLIVRQGAAVFWPREIAEVRLRAADGGAGEVLLGPIVQRRDRVSHGTGPAEGEDLEEWQLLLGNKDVSGRMFRFVDRSAVAEVSVPKGVWFAERREAGPAVFRPTRLVPGDGSAPVAADDPAFAGRLQAAIAASAARFDAIRVLERKEMGRVSRAIEELRRAGDAADPAERAALEARFAELATEATALRAAMLADKLEVTLADGRPRVIDVGVIVRAFAPNDLGLLAKVGITFSRLGEFLGGEPREANTEGGIFPAIFGTFVMTVLMSAAVMPFGVLAAIYLREYARQGLVVQAVRIAVNNLAGVPSIVFGVFGLGFFVYGVGGTIDSVFFADRPSATFGSGGLLWASLTLALMTVPVVIVAAEEALAAVPRGIREASLACGASKWQTIQRVVLPASGPGILTGLILAMARGAGEVAPLMLVGVVKLAPALPLDGEAPFLHLERKFMHLGFHIFDLGFQSPDSEAAQPMVFASTLLLILLVLVLNLGAILLRNRLRRKYASGTY